MTTDRNHDEVKAALERLRAAMEQLRRKIDGASIH